MKSFIDMDDASAIKSRDDIFNIEALYIEAIHTDPSRGQETLDRQGYFHPSAMAGCARRNVYEAMRAPLTPGVPDVDSMEIFQMGHMVHDRVQSVLSDVDVICEAKGLEWKFEAEVPFDRKKDRLFMDLRTGGTTDGCITIRDPGNWEQRGVLEIKSMKDDFWQKLTGPKPEHEMQANLYAFRWNVPIIWYWYYNKNNSQRKVYPTPVNLKVLDQALARLEMFNEHYDAGTLPDREESFFMCPRCEYKTVCDPPSLHQFRNRRGNTKKTAALVKRGASRLGRRGRRKP